MNRFPALVKREFQEHRNAFLVLPAVVALFLIVVLALPFFITGFTGLQVDVTMNSGNQSEAWHLEGEKMKGEDAIGIFFSRLPDMSEQERQDSLHKVFRGLAMPFLLILSLVVFFYLMGSLYEDRRDRSILFWKSMPVSDVSTVLSKLFTGVVALPVVYLLCIAIVQFTLLLIATLAATGQEISVWAHLWVPANLPREWLTLAAWLMYAVFWGMPFYGWILMVSAYVNSIPLVWIVGVPLGLAVIEGVLTDNAAIFIWWVSHARPVIPGIGDTFADQFPPSPLTMDMGAGLLVGFVFIVAAVWFRGERDEI